MTIHQTLSQLANQCVMCGLCIPHCPTYQLFQTENESPRGRIALFKALAEQQLDMSQPLFESLDHCLNCRACEKMCPSQVNYASISRLGRELIASYEQRPNSSLKQKLAEKVLETPSLHPFLKLTSKTIAPVQKLIPSRTNGSALKQFIQEVTSEKSATTPLKSFYPASNSKGQVILFKGCSGDLFEEQTLLDSIVLLNACGYDVTIPDKFSCCGAIKLRQGDNQGLLSQAQKTITNLLPYLSNSQAMVVLNNSCSGQLQEYDRFEQSNEGSTLDEADKVAQKSVDIIRFLLTAFKEGNVRFKPLTQKVSVHVSCSLKNVLKENELLLQLLQHIPHIQLQKLNDKFCCGAAGSYMLSYPDVANRLLDDKIKDIEQQQSTLIVSSNLGCTLHFKQGLEKRGKNVEVIHPVQLLARQLIKES